MKRGIIISGKESGESTAQWEMSEPGFFGSVRQLTCCARCGQNLPPGPDKKRWCADRFKPTLHFICSECFEALP